ncbi:MAG: hypothetical protein JRC90_09850 [Deltaproteobacteria bacterium]|nr:hypothetical protein [Deltaproteobacteria bacterium]
MVLPTSLLIHSATIQHSIWGVDAYGQPAITGTVDTIVSCRFVGAKETLVSDNGGYIKSLPKILLPPGTTVEDLDQIVSIEDGFAETYNIITKKVVYEAATKTVSHISCELAAVV